MQISIEYIQDVNNNKALRLITEEERISFIKDEQELIELAKLGGYPPAEPAEDSTVELAATTPINEVAIGNWMRAQLIKDRRQTAERLRDSGAKINVVVVETDDASIPAKRNVLRAQRLAKKEAGDYEEWTPVEKTLLLHELCYKELNPRIVGGWPENQALPSDFIQYIAAQCYDELFADLTEDERRFLDGLPQPSKEG